MALSMMEDSLDDSLMMMDIPESSGEQKSYDNPNTELADVIDSESVIYKAGIEVPHPQADSEALPSLTEFDESGDNNHDDNQSRSPANAHEQEELLNDYQAATESDDNVLDCCSRLPIEEIEIQQLKAQVPLKCVHVHSAMQLIRFKFPHLQGLQDPLYGDFHPFRFKMVKGPAIQILHTGKYHWVVCTNLLGCRHSGSHHDGSDSDSESGKGNVVHVFDSAYQSITNHTRNQIKCLFGEKSSIELIKCQRQCNDYDCGRMAIAFAMEIVFGASLFDIQVVQFDLDKLGSHLYDCFKKCNLTPFPADRLHELPGPRPRPRTPKPNAYSPESDALKSRNSGKKEHDKSDTESVPSDHVNSESDTKSSESEFQDRSNESITKNDNPPVSEAPSRILIDVDSSRVVENEPKCEDSEEGNHQSDHNYISTVTAETVTVQFQTPRRTNDDVIRVKSPSNRIHSGPAPDSEPGPVTLTLSASKFQEILPFTVPGPDSESVNESESLPDSLIDTSINKLSDQALRLMNDPNNERMNNFFDLHNKVMRVDTRKVLNNLPPSFRYSNYRVLGVDHIVNQIRMDNPDNILMFMPLQHLSLFAAVVLARALVSDSESELESNDDTSLISTSWYSTKNYFSTHQFDGFANKIKQLSVCAYESDCPNVTGQEILKLISQAERISFQLYDRNNENFIVGAEDGYINTHFNIISQYYLHILHINGQWFALEPVDNIIKSSIARLQHLNWNCTIESSDNSVRLLSIKKSKLLIFKNATHVQGRNTFQISRYQIYPISLTDSESESESESISMIIYGLGWLVNTNGVGFATIIAYFKTTKRLIFLSLNDFVESYLDKNGPHCSRVQDSNLNVETDHVVQLDIIQKLRKQLQGIQCQSDSNERFGNSMPKIWRFSEVMDSESVSFSQTLIESDSETHKVADNLTANTKSDSELLPEDVQLVNDSHCQTLIHTVTVLNQNQNHVQLVNDKLNVPPRRLELSFEEVANRHNDNSESASESDMWNFKSIQNLNQSAKPVTVNVQAEVDSEIQFESVLLTTSAMTSDSAVQVTKHCEVQQCDSHLVTETQTESNVTVDNVIEPYPLTGTGAGPVVQLAKNKTVTVENLKFNSASETLVSCTASENVNNNKRPSRTNGSIAQLQKEADDFMEREKIRKIRKTGLRKTVTVAQQQEKKERSRVSDSQRTPSVDIGNLKGGKIHHAISEPADQKRFRKKTHLLKKRKNSKKKFNEKKVSLINKSTSPQPLAGPGDCPVVTVTRPGPTALNLVANNTIQSGPRRMVTVESESDVNHHKSKSSGKLISKNSKRKISNITATVTVKEKDCSNQTQTKTHKPDPKRNDRESDLQIESESMNQMSDSSNTRLSESESDSINVNEELLLENRMLKRTSSGSSFRIHSIPPSNPRKKNKTTDNNVTQSQSDSVNCYSQKCLELTVPFESESNLPKGSLPKFNISPDSHCDSVTSSLVKTIKKTSRIDQTMFQPDSEHEKSTHLILNQTKSSESDSLSDCHSQTDSESLRLTDCNEDLRLLSKKDLLHFIKSSIQQAFQTQPQTQPLNDLQGNAMTQGASRLQSNFKESDSNYNYDNHNVIQFAHAIGSQNITRTKNNNIDVQHHYEEKDPFKSKLMRQKPISIVANSYQPLCSDESDQLTIGNDHFIQTESSGNLKLNSVSESSQLPIRNRDDRHSICACRNGAGCDYGNRYHHNDGLTYHPNCNCRQRNNDGNGYRESDPIASENNRNDNDNRYKCDNIKLNSKPTGAAIQCSKYSRFRNLPGQIESDSTANECMEQCHHSSYTTLNPKRYDNGRNFGALFNDNKRDNHINSNYINNKHTNLGPHFCPQPHSDYHTLSDMVKENENLIYAALPVPNRSPYHNGSGGYYNNIDHPTRALIPALVSPQAASGPSMTSVYHDNSLIIRAMQNAHVANCLVQMSRL